MAENAKRRRLDDASAEQASGNVSNYQIIASSNSLIDMNQALVFNQLPVIQNQQLLYSLPQVQGLNSGSNGQQYYLFIPSNENVPNQSTSATIQSENEDLDKAQYVTTLQSNGDLKKDLVKNEIIVFGDIKNENEEKMIQVSQKEPGIIQYDPQGDPERQVEQVFIVRNDSSKPLVKHSNNAWKSQLYRCEYKGCTETFPSLHQKKLHLEAHIFPESEEYKCSICNMVFKKAADRNKHITSHSIVSTYKCKECQKAFPYYTTLIKHVESKVCSKSSPLDCFYCKAKFYSTGDLVKHHKLSMKKCEVCSTSICGDQAFHIHSTACRG